MEPSSLPGGMFSSMGSGMLGLEMPLQQSQPQQNPQNPHHIHHHPHHQQHPQMVAFAHPDPDHNPQSQQPVKHGYPYVTKAKQQLTLSDEDEPGLTGDDSTADGKRKVSPWHRMKWTDSMVRLLIMAVFYIGDEGGSDGSDPSAKKKTGVLLQKKGKWKSVSRAMMEKGFYVSPQQCEDKFNDLNKRYKRVNDILGKGTACRVVENQSLLDTMDQLSPKMKDEVRKLLNSKHLFFREMCAYHNSCNGGGTPGAHHSPPETAVEPPQHQQQHQQYQHQQRCLHSSTENATVGPNATRAETEASKMVKMGSGEEDEDYDEDYEDEDDDDDEEEVVEGGIRSQNEHGHEEDDENEGGSSRKRVRKGLFPSPSPSTLMRQLSSEVMSVLQDGTKSALEKKQWMKSRMMQLEEQRVSYQCKAFELEKQRLKWVKFSSKKEREMEREKLVNQRRRLENERMALLLRQKEVELLEIHQQQQQQQQQQHSSNKRGDLSSFAG